VPKPSEVERGLSKPPLVSLSSDSRPRKRRPRKPAAGNARKPLPSGTTFSSPNAALTVYSRRRHGVTASAGPTARPAAIYSSKPTTPSPDPRSARATNRKLLSPRGMASAYATGANQFSPDGGRPSADSTFSGRGDLPSKSHPPEAKPLGTISFLCDEILLPF
jgi:hypothetical protein